jgi:uncharacterized protein with PIN domain
MSKADEPEAINCYYCGEHMTKKDRIETARFVRVLWRCTKCPSEYWKMYSDDEGSRRESKQRWH